MELLRGLNRIRGNLSQSKVMAFVERALGFVFPAVCQFCRAEFASSEEGYLCSRCWQRLRFVRRPFCEQCGLPFAGELTTTFQCSNCCQNAFAFRGARSAVLANDFALDLIHRYKYQSAMWLEPVLAGLLWNSLRELGMNRGWDLIVPVPLYPTKKREREFNQAERISGRLAKQLGASVDCGLLKRVAPTASQTMLSRSERRENVRGAFAAGSSRSLKGLRIMLVDDVFTTGATTDACARILRRMGSSEIWVSTVDRGL